MINMETKNNTGNIYRRSTKILLKGITKISLNKWYAGTFWAKRKKIKDEYTLLVRNQFKYVFPKDKNYEVEYVFGFRTRPLDASNTIAMVKMIEDIIFEDDGYKTVNKIIISSEKSRSDYIKIIVNELDNNSIKLDNTVK